MNSKKKVESAESIYECINVQFIRGQTGVINHEDILNALESDGKLNEEYSEDDVPEYLVVNAQVPYEAPSLIYSASKNDFGASLISHYALKDGIRAKATTAIDLFLRLLKQGESTRHGISFKAIGYIDTWENSGLPEAVRGYNGKPALVTDSATIFRRNNICVIDFDVRMWSYLARQSFHTAFSGGTTKNNVLRIGFLVEGKSSDELPEQMLGCFCVSEIDKNLLPTADAGSPMTEDGGKKMGGGLLKKVFG